MNHRDSNYPIIWLNAQTLQTSPGIIFTISDANIIFLDTIASKLTDKVKASKYGKKFIEFIHSRKIDEAVE